MDGLILCGQRWYAPGYARWLSRDPDGYDGGVDLYAYCSGDPVNEIDPDGTDTLDQKIAYWQGSILKLQSKLGNLRGKLAKSLQDLETDPRGLKNKPDCGVGRESRQWHEGRIKDLEGAIANREAEIARQQAELDRRLLQQAERDADMDGAASESSGVNNMLANTSNGEYAAAAFGLPAAIAVGLFAAPAAGAVVVTAPVAATAIGAASSFAK